MPKTDRSGDAEGTPPKITRQRLREIFGDVDPDTTSDERDDVQPAESSQRDEWLRANRPPHHD